MQTIPIRLAFRRLILVAAISLGAFYALAETDGVWEYSYSDYDYTATVTKYTGTASSVTVPSSFSREVPYQEKDEDGHWVTKYRTYHYTVTATSGTFSGNTHISSVLLPSSVTIIGSSTFEGCTSLTSAPIHSSLQSIGWGAFSRCKSLTEIVLPTSLTNLGEYAFSECSGLVSAQIDGTDLLLRDRTFLDCSNLESIVIGNGVKLESWYNSWRGGPFARDYKLKWLEIGTGVTSISSFFCYDLRGLETVVFHGNVQSIGYKAFYGCANLTSVSMGGTPNTVGELAFCGCSRLVGAIDLSQCETIEPGTFYGCSQLAGPIDLSRCKTIGSDAFRDCSSLAFGNLTLPSIKLIGNTSFYGCGGMTSVTLPSGLISLGDAAFSSCSGLVSAIIDGAGITLPDGILSDCGNLETVIIGDGVNLLASYYIDSYGRAGGPFANDYKLKRLEVGTGATQIGDNFCYKLAGLETVVFRGLVHGVGRNAFGDCTKLVGIIDLSQCETIGSGAFYNCSALQFGDLALASAKMVGDGAFGNCDGITAITLPTCLTSLGVSALENCDGLVSARIDGTDVSVKYWAFKDCVNLETVVIGDGVKSIEGGVFQNDAKLRRLDVGTGVTNVYCCYGLSGLESAVFHGNVQSIGDWAFDGCYSLTSVSFGGAPKEIGNDAFFGCGNLVGTIDLSRCEKIDNYAFYNCSALEFGDLALASAKMIGVDAFLNCDGITAITLPTCLTSLGDSAFSGCDGLVSARIDGRDLTLQDSTFRACGNLETVVIGDGVNFKSAYRDILSGPFVYDNKLRRLEVGNGVTVIGDYFGYGLSGLESAVFHGDIQYVGVYAFGSCNKLPFIAVGGAPKTIASRAFSDCSMLVRTIDLSRCETIGSGAFYYCKSLEDVTIPKSVTSIEYDAFRYSPSLTNVWFEGEPPLVGDAAFRDIAPSARGHYQRSLADKWLPQIGSDGKWNGLIMHELSQPVLRVKEANPAEGSITLAWDDGTEGQCVSSYSIYRSANGTYTEADRVATGIVDTEWTDTNYWTAEPVLSPLNYWVVAESDYFDLPASNAVETRHRYGLAVGYDDYETRGDGHKPTPHSQSLADASLFKTIAESKAGFTEVELLNNEKATTNGIHNAFAKWAGVVKPGDAFAFYIATHGGYSAKKAKAALTAYDGPFWVSDLVNDSGLIPYDVLFIGIVMSCHSRAMVDYSENNSADFQYQIANGLAQCRANSAWISSCGYNESSYNSPTSTNTAFGEWFLEEGWQNGFADTSLHGVGYAGVIGDGRLTLLELAKYAHAFYRGKNDAKPSNVYWDIETERLLERFVINTNCRPANIEVPVPPDNLSATGKGFHGIELTWDAVDGAKVYWLYRQNANESEPMSCIGYQYTLGNGRIYDDNINMFETYRYYVRAVNPVGASELGLPALGTASQSDYMEFLAASATDIVSSDSPTPAQYEAAAASIGKNGVSLESSFIAGLTPDDSSSKFTTTITMDADGKPVVSWTPDLNEGGTKNERVYRILGAKTLDGEVQWDDVTDIADPGAAGYRFFKATVEMP